MHAEQQEFCRRIKEKFPDFFKGTRVVDFGALDINGSNRELFEDCHYTGVDIGAGKNVDVVSLAHEYTPGTIVDVVISTEMLEHDQHWRKSLQRMFEILRPGGLLFFTCATTGRAEHGTARTSPADSPFTTDYYCNLAEADIRSLWPRIEVMFSDGGFEIGPPNDLRFWGVKNVDPSDS